MLRLLKESLRMYRRKLSFKGFHQYKGDHKTICKAIINDCFDPKKQFFRTSTGHFNQFYSRDFGLCTGPLLKLGYKGEVHRTLQYALSIFSRHNAITTQITPDNIPVNSFHQSTDSLPFLLRSLRLAKATDLVEVYRPFLQEQALEYKEKVIDSSTGLVKSHRYFSSMKDGYKRNSSCYDNCCASLLQQELNSLHLRNPLKKYNYEKLILDNFWNGKYFYDDLDKDKYVAGDANTFPFYFDIITDKNIKKKALTSIHTEKLDKPLPLKYTNTRNKKKELFWPKVLAPNYEGNTTWLHLGMAYIEVIQPHDKKLAGQYLKKVKELIEKHKTFPEVLNPDSTPYSSPFYQCDEGMLWASIYLSLISDGTYGV
ncbi:MAG: hypothetical protein ABIJ21_03980 [Nanoarchaeota archaeon]